jgi:hypothetical protein
MTPSRSPLHAVFALSATLCACSSSSGAPPTTAPAPAAANVTTNLLTPAERAAGWRLLFDGRSTDGWRGFRKASMPSGWAVVDGALTRTGDGGDIVTTQQFKNFELALEWKVAAGGNSGIFYRASENDDAIYWTAPEMQVLDDAGHPDGKSRLTAAGSDYGLYEAPSGIVKPAGQWNQARIIVNGRHVEHWLNGVRMLQYELWSPDWEMRVRGSKFAPHAHYGRNTEGFIGLQDHGDWVAFRSIKIRVLP